MIWTLIWKYVVGAGVVVALGAGVWFYGHGRYTEGYAARDVVAQQEAAQLLAQSRATEVAAQTQMEKVRNDAEKQKAVAVAAIDSLRAESDGLRDTIAKAARRAKAQAAGAATGADADAARAWQLFDSCRARYEAVVRDTDGYVEDLRIGQGWAKVVSGVK